MRGMRSIARMWFALVAVTMLAACGGGDGAPQAPAPINISALLTRSQENPAFTNFSSSGTGTVTVDPATRKISGVVVTTGVAGTSAHIHSGAPGVAGPVEIPLAGGPTVWTVPDNTILTEAQLAALTSGGLYFNVHSDKFPEGEIRGQITQQARFASLSGANEVPPNASTASGTGVLAFNPATKGVSGFVRTTGVTGVAAHVHSGAAGTSGPVVIPLAETAPGSGIWAVPGGFTFATPQEEADFMVAFNAGTLYFNVHSAAFPDGEIRGQILSATLSVRNALLTGSQETPPVLTGATGKGVAVVNSITREVFADVKSFAITGTAAHIHEGAVGVAGGVRVPLTETTPGSGIWIPPAGAVLTPQLLSQFGAGNLYFNVHSAAFPAGEIRGQINLLPADNIFTLGGGAVVAPPVAGPAPQPVFPSTGVSFSGHVQQIFNLYCVACHGPARVASFFLLTAGVSYGNLVNAPALSLALPGTRVIPGDSANSVLYQRVSGAGLPDQTLRMPLGGPFLDTLNPSAIAAIKGWIDEGARNN